MKNSLLFIISIMVCAASSAQTFSGGKGTQSDPYLISNISDLKDLSAMVDNVTGENSTTYGKYFLLTQDITEPFTGVIGDEYAFNGHFDGNGHTIRVDIIRPYESYVGLFTTASQGSIRNLSVEGAVMGYHAVGAIVANPTNGLLMENLVNYADVTATSTSVLSAVGGVIGYMVSRSGGKGCTVRNCANYGTVSCYGSCVGGVIGYSGQQLGNTITAVANYGHVIGIADEQHRVGGVIGNPLYDDVVHQVANFGTISDRSISGCMGNGNPEEQGELFYDCQYAPSDAVFPLQARTTSEAVGHGLAGSLPSDNWVFEDELFPRLIASGQENSPRAILYATPVILDESDQVDHIGKHFRVVTRNGVTWTSKNGKVLIKSDGTAYPLAIGADELTATLDGYTRTLNIYVSTTTDGIEAIQHASAADDSAIYDLQGRKWAGGMLVNQPTKKGIYIRNGRKIVIK